MSKYKKMTFKVNGYVVYVNPVTNEVRVGSRGTSMPVGWIYGTMPKGEARKLRKKLRADGQAAMAAQPRVLIV